MSSGQGRLIAAGVHQHCARSFLQSAKADISAGHMCPLLHAHPHSPAENDSRWVKADMALPADGRLHDIAAVSLQCAGQ